MHTLPHNRPTLGIREAWAATRTIFSGWVAQGPQVEAFENDLCRYLGLPSGHAVCVSSGTAALYLALYILGATEKRIGLPVYACSALRNAVLMNRAVPVYFDSSDDSPNIDVGQLDTSAIDIAIIPHTFGIPANILGVPKSIKIVEDCAQAIGARISGHSAGTIGDISVFSFYASKLITTGGQGGAVVSKDKALVDLIRDYREFDCRRDNHARFNFQMTDLQASIGRVQLSRLTSFLNRRQQIFSEYVASGLNLVGSNIGGTVCYRAILKTDQQNHILSILSKNGIKAIIPLEEWELLENPLNFPNARNFCATTISLPVYPTLTNRQIKTIVKECHKI
jgi:perosamine synthetase